MTVPAVPGGGAAATAGDEDRRRILEDAQREADTVFAQYQLSQLVALGGSLRSMAASVIGELVRASDAVAGALWLAAPGGRDLALVAAEANGAPPPPAFPAAAAADAWARSSGWYGVALDERRDLGDGELDAEVVGFLALRPPAGDSLPPDRIRLLALVRHELAIAFRAAQLREALAAEQALLAAILDGANDGIVAVDRARRVVRANPAAMALLGRADDGAGLACRALLGCDAPAGGAPRAPDAAAPGAPPAAASPGGPAGDEGPGQGGPLRCGPRCAFEAVLEGPEHLVEGEPLLLAADGTEIPVAASFSAMPGEQPGAVLVLRDLRAERAAEELRSSFLAAVSHDLRTPLSLISGYVDSLLALDLDPAAQRRSVERIGHAATRLQELVEELLELTRLEQASLELKRARVDPGVLLAGLVRDLGESPGMPPVHVAVPSDLPAVEVDPVRIGHVLGNLVDNARKYAGDGTITVTARRARGMVVVSVQDEGPGIPPEERPLIFDRFYRGRLAREARVRGSGLGLYVCRRLVEAHGGRIWVEPEPRRSAVSFSLPPARRRGTAGAARP